jgi:hypothetical protein
MGETQEPPRPRKITARFLGFPLAPLPDLPKVKGKTINGDPDSKKHALKRSRGGTGNAQRTRDPDTAPAGTRQRRYPAAGGSKVNSPPGPGSKGTTAVTASGFSGP